MEKVTSEILSEWHARLESRPDWAKVIEVIKSWPITHQKQLSEWVDRFHLNPNLSYEAAILLEECRLQEKGAALEALNNIEVEKGQAASSFMRLLRNIRRPQLEALREDISLQKKRFQTPKTSIHYPDDLELDEFEIRFKVRTMGDWDAIAESVKQKRDLAETLLQTIQSGHVES